MIESMHAATVRTGYCTNVLAGILADAGVEPVNGGRQRWFYTTDVDRAVALRESTETAHAAAMRRGVDRRSLRSWLLSAGIVPPSNGKTWRVKSDVLDAIVSEKTRRAA